MRKKFLLSVLLAILAMSGMQAQTTAKYYVDASVTSSGTGTGTWANAFKTLQEALAATLTTGDEIWVAQGTYQPAAGNFFTIPTGVVGIKIYGGFVSGNNVPNPVTNVTTLQGNGSLVVTIYDASVTLDGFTITGGKATSFGAGVYIRPTATNATLSNLIITQNTLTGNSGSGGGVYIGGANATLSNLIITQNTLTGNSSRGAGVYITGANATLDRLTISKNTVGSGGAGVYIDAAGLNATLSNSSIFENEISSTSGVGGAGVYMATGSSGLTLLNSKIYNNTSLSVGDYQRTGGVLFVGAGNQVVNSLISGNSGDNRWHDFSLYLPGTEVTFTNSTVVTTAATGNTFSIIGGTTLTLKNSIITTNQPSGQACFFIHLNDSKIDCDNSFLQGVDAFEGSQIKVTYENCLPGDANPAGFFEDMDGNDFALSSCSPAINQGNNTFATGIINDLAGNSRTINSTVDMGCYESSYVYIANPTIELDNSVLENGSEMQIVGEGIPFTDIYLVIGGSATGASLSPSDAGLTLINTGGNQYKLSGMPTGGLGDYQYSITTTGPTDDCYRRAEFEVEVAVVLPVTPNEHGVLYVKKGATGNGSSWEDALGELSDALHRARIVTTGAPAVAEIWVAEGTYFPAHLYGNSIKEQYPTTPRDYFFLMMDGINVYGGFPANASTANNTDKDNILHRNWDKWKTILSGDINGDDIPGDFSTNKEDNLHHVVVSAGLRENTELNGFVITGGFALGGDHEDALSGLDGVFSGVRRSYGGGIACYGWKDKSETVSFYGKNLRITENYASISGGGVYIDEFANPVFVNTLIDNNSAITAGGGVYISDWIISGSPPRPGVLRSAITSNIPLFTNVTIADNTANSSGGVYVSVYNDGRKMILNNSIVWGNNNGGIGTNGSYSNTVTKNSSIVQGDDTTDPLFVDSDNSTISLRNYRLQSESPAIDAGNNGYYATAVGGGTIPAEEKDLAADSRVINTTIDMGAYEYEPEICPFEDNGGIVYVKDYTVPNVTGTEGDGSSWDTAHGDLAYVLHIARKFPDCVTQIYLAEGTFYPKYDLATNELPTSEDDPRNVSFAIPNGVNIEGGYPATMTGTDIGDEYRHTRDHESVFSGDIGTKGDISDNAYKVVTILPSIDESITDGPVVDGITVRGGNANCNDVGRASTSKCRLENIPELPDMSVSSSSGAGITIIGTNPVIKNSVVTENNSADSGGGIYVNVANSNVEVDLINVVIDHNNASNFGGGVYLTADNNIGLSATLRMTNVTLADNEAQSAGGIYVDERTTLGIDNSIVWGNTDSDTGTATDNIQIGNGGTSDTKSSLIEGADNGGSWNTAYGTNSDGRYYDFDPKFISPNAKNPKGQYDYTLGKDSPAINKGDNELYETAIERINGVEYDGIPASEKDAYWNNRVIFKQIDLGAVESNDFCPPILVWTAANNSASWDDQENWYPNYLGAPKSCTDVYIPGNVAIFPSLIEGGQNTCRDIYFMPGAQLGRPDLLDYQEAHVQIDYNGNSSGYTRTTLTNDALIGANTEERRDAITSAERVAFGAATTGVTLDRDCWHTFSAPLGDMYAGDFSFGGFPFSFIKKFSATGEGSHIRGTWEDYSNEAKHKFAPGQGFGHFYYPYKENTPYGMDNSAGEGDTQWNAAKTYNGLKAATPQHIKQVDDAGDNTEFGLVQSNGILHFPYFDDEYLSDARRGHSYNEGTKKSTFHFFWQSPLTSEGFLQWTDNSESDTRSEKAYKFITEDWDGTYDAGTVNQDHNIVLVGNPYMSALDFDAFYDLNKDNIKNVYHIFHNIKEGGKYVRRYATYGTSGMAGDGEIELTTDQYIAPMQSFLVEVADGVTDLTLDFDAATMAVTSTTSVLLAPAAPASNRLVITATNEKGSDTAFLRQSDDAKDSFCNDDFSKLIDNVSDRPEVYTLVGVDNGKSRALLMNTIQSNNVVIPVGIASNQKGRMSISVKGMDSYLADIFFVDAVSHTETEITGRDSFTYSFEYAPEGENSTLEDRFSLRVQPAPTAIDRPAADNNIQAYFSNSDLIITAAGNDAILSVAIYDPRGVCLVQAPGNGSAQQRLSNALTNRGVYIVKVRTQQGARDIKIIR